MDVNQKRKISRNIMIASILLVVVVIAFMFWCAMTERTETYFYNLAVIFFLVVYCFLTDYLEPKLCKEFEGISEERKAAYRRFLILDIVGYAGLAFFLVFIYNGSIGILGVVAYALTVKPKREARTIFYKRTQPETKTVVRPPEPPKAEPEVIEADAPEEPDTEKIDPAGPEETEE
ncbi:MAG: hypothetical protein Q4F41_10140 [Eubacteriales bacterium]|nr:hypothetical protein [Eubacteriales bacterium]